jgi:hypothetical protein
MGDESAYRSGGKTTPEEPFLLQRVFCMARLVVAMI